MQSLDYRVVGQAVQWLEEGRTVWFCTVLSTFGSSPREPGSLMVATSGGSYLGSLSGGCVEEDFLERLAAGEYDQPATIVSYGEAQSGEENPRVRLPCGGRLEVLVERLVPNQETIHHFVRISETLAGGHELLRTVRLTDGFYWLEDTGNGGPRVVHKEAEEVVLIRIGAIAKLILAGYSTVAQVCADFAISLGYHVVLCDPREEVTAGLDFHTDIEFIPQHPSLYIASEGACTPSTAVVAVTHDPRIDDLAMMAAVKTPAGYIGVMGSLKTSKARAERLARTGGLSSEQIERIHMPIGLDLGSKTPAEIALSIMADVVRVRRGK